jgi:hypothetical protein
LTGFEKGVYCKFTVSDSMLWKNGNLIFMPCGGIVYGESEDLISGDFFEFSFHLCNLSV